jgi:hypothetical protein
LAEATPPWNTELEQTSIRDNIPQDGPMWRIAVLLAAILIAGILAACTESPLGPVHGVSTSGATNMGGAPGTANDPATGGQGNRFRMRR